MDEKKDYIHKLAAFLNDNNKVMSGEELAEHLNRNDFTTSYGTKYQGGIGTYRLISETYKWTCENFGEDAAEKVARAFVTPSREYAFEK